mmetsp:Transcript_7189/g.10299  ORF Transcript_7189/g.10299 Transcript_7189/m.10299 type:complete len:91 (-) Transcript_7189:726-998(-)
MGILDDQSFEGAHHLLNDKTRSLASYILCNGITLDIVFDLIEKLELDDNVIAEYREYSHFIRCQISNTLRPKQTFRFHMLTCHHEPAFHI